LAGSAAGKRVVEENDSLAMVPRSALSVAFVVCAVSGALVARTTREKRRRR
jgi:hypothetical protein